MTDWTTARVTTEMLAELRRLHSEWQETVNPYGFCLMPSGEYYALAAAAVDALPALLDDADALRAELAHMTEARNNARAEVERLAAVVEAVREYAAARQANIDHGPLLSARKAAHDALLAALARLDEEPQP